MFQEVSIIGGDLRNVFLAEIISKQNKKVFLYGFDKEENIIQNNNIKKCESLEEAIKSCKIIISSIPFSKDKKIINMPYCSNEIMIDYFFEKIKNKTLIAGSINEELVKKAEKNCIKTVDLMKNEELVIYNTIATAEGAIQIAMEETRKTIYKSNILVLGFGRVGKTILERLNGFKANIYCEARKEEDIAWIKVYGYNPISLNDLNDNIEKFDIIINTIPKIIIQEEQLRLMKKDCLIIDLASKPGGIDFEKAQEIGIKTIHALGLPGKVAPYTSADFINKVIEKILKTKE